MFWHWKGKGRGRKDSKEAWKELPPECWEAIRRYLKAAGRWDAMEPESAVFTALSERAANLPTISNELWDPHAKPLSAREVNRLVKKYARRAGLDPNDVHVHTLRHSAAMLMDEAGADVEEIRKFLNHESLNTTQTYMHKMKGQRNVHAGKMAELLGL
jgi:integrase/recombinase XerC